MKELLIQLNNALKEYDLCIDEIFYLLCLQENIISNLQLSDKSIDKLLKLNLLVSYKDNIINKNKVNQLMNKNKTYDIINESKVETWIQEYRELFRILEPDKVKAIGDRSKCIIKMKVFITKYPQYTKDIIIEATKYGIKQELKRVNNNKKMVRQADYFISKNTGEVLEGSNEDLLYYCEEYVYNKTKKTIPVHDKFGETVI